MIRYLTICSALFASSGAGAVALSVIHASVYNVSVSAFAEPENSDVFMIPAFAPVRSVSDVKPTVLNNIVAPTLAPHGDVDYAEVVPTPVLFSSGLSSDSFPVPEVHIKTDAVRSKAKAAPVERQKHGSQASTSMTTPMIVPEVKRKIAEPVVRTTVVKPKYFIGAYR